MMYLLMNPGPTWTSNFWVVLGVIQNCQHYQERTRSVLLLYSSYQKGRPTLKMMILSAFLKSQCTVNDIFEKHTMALDHTVYAHENDDNSG